jgi:hypothetical protein
VHLVLLTSWATNIENDETDMYNLLKSQLICLLCMGPKKYSDLKAGLPYNLKRHPALEDVLSEISNHSGKV